MLIKKQAGFGVVPIIVIIAAIAVLGFVGFRLLTTQSSKPATNNATANNQSKPISNTQTSAAPAAQTDPNAGYVVIKEWGVRFKPVSGLNDVEYVIWSTGKNVAFTTEELKKLSPQCDATENSGFSGMGAIYRSAVGSSVPSPNQAATTINGYNYYISGGQAACTDSPTLNTDTLLLLNSLKFLEAAK